MRVLRPALAACAALALALVQTEGATAGVSADLECNQVVTGSLTGPGDQAELTFYGSPGDVISVAAWRADVGGTLSHQIVRPDGSTFPGPASFRQQYTLAQTGTPAMPHRVRVTTGAGAGGPFAVEVTWLNDRAACRDDLACGVERAVSLDDTLHWHTWTFDGLSGQRVALQAWRTGGDPTFQPRYRVYRPDGTPLQTAFQDGLKVDPTFLLDADGVYTVAVRTETSVFGDLEMKLLRFEDAGGAFASCGPVPLCGQTLAGQGDATDATPAREWQTFRVDAAAGEVIGVSTWREAGDASFTPEHRFYDRGGSPLGPGFAQGFAATALPADAGTYTLAVKTRESPTGAGDFGLSIFRLSQGGQCAATLPCGQVHSEILTPENTVRVFQLDAVVGDDLAVETRDLSGGGFLPEAALFDPNGIQVASFQPGRFPWTATTTGTHTIVVRSSSPTVTGTFALFWEGLGPANLCEITDGDLDDVPDDADNCPVDPNPGQEDADLDTVGDDCDNCPVDANMDQQDTDADSFGDACEPSELQTKCLATHLKTLSKMCKAAFACESKRVKNPAKDPLAAKRDACLDKAEAKFDKTSTKAQTKLGPCLMPANYLVVATSLGSDSRAVSDAALQGFDELDPADTKVRSKIVKSMAKSCQGGLKGDAKAVKKAQPYVDTSLLGFAAACDKAVVQSDGVYDGAGCGALGALLEVLQEELGQTARGR